MKIIKNSEFYTPFYDAAIASMIRRRLKQKLFIEVYLKGGRFSGKSYYVVNQIIELCYLDPARSAIVIAMTLTDHQERGVILFEKILAELGLLNEWKWRTKKTRPVLTRNVNGFKQEIRFLSLSDLETAGFEPPINEATGKTGYYGIMWNDEMSKKTDNNPDADFTYVERLNDAIMTAKNTFVRHMKDDQTMVLFNSLNPWGEGNPIVTKFHKILGDDYDKLVSQGYNLGYLDDDETFTIAATTNYKVNTKLGGRALKSVRAMRNDPRADTMIYGMTGRVLNSSFGRELSMIEGLNKGGNVPKDHQFIPMNLSMDVGTASPSALYLNGFDNRYLIKAGGDYYPTRIITKGEYIIDPKKDLRGIPEKYKDLLRHIQGLSYRFPELKKGITLFVDGSAVDTIELLKAYLNELKNEDITIDIDEWLTISPQRDKWKTTEKREHRRDRFSTIVGAYAYIIDKNECPEFFNMTAKIVSTKSEQQFDHCYDAVMYGIMPLYKYLEFGLQLKAKIGKPDPDRKME